MSSIDAYDRFAAVLDRVELAQYLFFASTGSLTGSELIAALDRYAFLMGQLDALIYELSSPFGWPGERRA
ncbi:hypothetical protein U8D42_08910 [Mycobacterium europaeum]|uniref:hypothetical protein n=1 Tax=Mycobacterium europaeum TaxID=761804 RepID=UPI002ADF6451|nr:hypothetical protein [Mycobacterium europaeum]MEA1162499.1 hypothetical protein [Mycobacterium europaeum]